MIIQDNLDISERGRFDVDDSQELRWNNGEIEFYNRDHDRLSYVSSAVSVINKAFWLSAQKIRHRPEFWPSLRGSQIMIGLID